MAQLRTDRKCKSCEGYMNKVFPEATPNLGYHLRNKHCEYYRLKAEVQKLHGVIDSLHKQEPLSDSLNYYVRAVKLNKEREKNKTLQAIATGKLDKASCVTLATVALKGIEGIT